MTLEVKVEQDPVVFHVVIFENSICAACDELCEQIEDFILGKQKFLF